MGVKWGWRVGCGSPTSPLDDTIEELDRLLYVFRSFKWDFKGEALSDKVGN
jgi:hypothetical protein